MLFKRKTKTPQVSPVLVVDALGFADRIQSANAEGLVELAHKLEQQYYQFRAKIPFAAVIVTRRRVFGTGEFSTFQLNDMFVLFSQKGNRDYKDLAFRHLVASSLLYQVLLLEGFVPRGGLGFGLVLQRRQALLGYGFIDAYRIAEKRSAATRHVCAIQISPAFIARMPPTEQSYRMLCFYERSFFLNPRFLVDPEMGKFDNDRIMNLLRSAGANQEKLDATDKFLHELEDFDAAKRPNSHSWEIVRQIFSDLP
jgi:hypothetical protein